MTKVAISFAKADDTNRHLKNLVYQVGDRVIFVVTINSTCGMNLGSRVTGTIINAFEAAGLRIYRIQLDTKPKSIVGNIFAYEIRLPL